MVVVVSLVVCDVVGDDVAVLVPVVVVVSVVVCELVTVLVWLDVGDVVVGDVVAVVLVVTEVVGLVVGVVISHSWNPPPTKSSVISLSVVAIPAHVSGSAVMPLPTQVISLSSPAGPRYSFTAAAIASPISLQLSVSSLSPTKLVST